MAGRLVKKNDEKLRPAGSFFVFLLIAVSAMFLVSCSELQKPVPQPFFAETPPPPKQEFRWSNGKMPKSFDPARAAAAPETDIVRAVFEGLTEIDSRTLKEIPAIAEKWTSSSDLRVWTFQLRKEAKWSNGEHVTAEDFVISWTRLSRLGQMVANRELFQNIVGMRSTKAASPSSLGHSDDFLRSPASGTEPPPRNDPAGTKSPLHVQDASPQTAHQEKPAISEHKDEKVPTDAKPAAEKIGVEAVNDLTLKVTLDVPDKDFAKLVANPIFRPIYGDGLELENVGLDREIVTNGAFRIANVGSDGITLERADYYWNKASVKLDRIRFVRKDNAEAALEAYKKGELDAITNADFAPLALKLLAPFEDFRKTTHSALNYYEFNARRAPYNDRRVREALTISIDRERLTEGEMEGLTQPATSFLPLGESKHADISLDIEKARQLLELAGYPNGANFPPIRLLVNRNETQQRIARTVARMWKQNLNLDTVIDVKEVSELEIAKSVGDYDLVRRGIVLPTVDETAGMAAIFGVGRKTVEDPSKLSPSELETLELQIEKSSADVKKEIVKGPSAAPSSDTDIVTHGTLQNAVVTEEEAIFELNAIPLYFPISYSLIKPYVKGFELNGLDAPLLQEVSIDNNWLPKKPKSEP